MTEQDYEVRTIELADVADLIHPFQTFLKQAKGQHQGTIRDARDLVMNGIGQPHFLGVLAKRREKIEAYGLCIAQYGLAGIEIIMVQAWAKDGVPRAVSEEMLGLIILWGQAIGARFLIADTDRANVKAIHRRWGFEELCVRMWRPVPVVSPEEGLEAPTDGEFEEGVPQGIPEAETTIPTVLEPSLAATNAIGEEA